MSAETPAERLNRLYPVVNSQALERANRLNNIAARAMSVDGYGRLERAAKLRDKMIARAYGIQEFNIPDLRMAQAEAYRATFGRRS